jgi:hypothetical protein
LVDGRDVAGKKTGKIRGGLADAADLHAWSFQQHPVAGYLGQGRGRARKGDIDKFAECVSLVLSQDHAAFVRSSTASTAATTFSAESGLLINSFAPASVTISRV